MQKKASSRQKSERAERDISSEVLLEKGALSQKKIACDPFIERGKPPPASRASRGESERKTRDTARRHRFRESLFSIHKICVGGKKETEHRGEGGAFYDPQEDDNVRGRRSSNHKK